jgi:hydroxymethylpyrimidine/phosphomethylpyrimidine kinase
MAMSDLHVLIVAGADSSGGAGIARDLETVAGHSFRACVAVTAVTAQTHEAVQAIEPMPARLVAEQMHAALASNRVGAIKIGMLATAGIVAAVADVLRTSPEIPVVLDPVLAASSGGALLESEAIARLKQNLIPLCRVVTPNWIELAMLTGREPAADEAEALRQGDMLLETGGNAILIKGGHARSGSASDILLSGGAPVRFDARRIPVAMRGTGCMLASAIASGLARGASLEDSVRAGRARVRSALEDVADMNAAADRCSPAARAPSRL